MKRIVMLHDMHYRWVLIATLATSIAVGGLVSHQREAAADLPRQLAAQAAQPPLFGKYSEREAGDTAGPASRGGGAGSSTGAIGPDLQPGAQKPGQPIAYPRPASYSTKIPPGVLHDVALNDVIGGGDKETVAVAVAPGDPQAQACPGGRLVVHSGPRGYGTSGADLIVHDLSKDGNDAHRVNVPAPSGGRMFNYDAQLLRTPSELLYFRSGISSAAPDFSNMFGKTRQQAMDAYAAWSPFNGGERFVYFLWRSTDCGEHWSKAEIAIDTATAVASNEGGRCGWPRFHSGNLRDGKDGAFPSPEGFDRPELMVDPNYPKRMYFSVTCRTGGDIAKPEDRKELTLEQKVLEGHNGSDVGVVMRSRDAGSTWVTIDTIDDHFVPMVLTTVGGSPGKPSLPVLFYCADAEVPTIIVYHSVGLGTLTLGRRFTVASVEGKPGSAKVSTTCYEGQPRSKLQKQLPGGYFYNIDSLAISRIGKRDSANRYLVRIAYPTLAGNGREEIVVARVPLAPTSGKTKLVKDAIETLHIKSKVGQAVFPTFVEADRVQAQAKTEDRALLYWMETVPGVRPGYSARYAIATGAFKWSNVGALAGGQHPRVSYVTKNQFIGDYFKGAFLGTSFLAQWTEQGYDNCSAGYRARYRIIARGPYVPPVPKTSAVADEPCNLAMVSMSATEFTVRNESPRTTPATTYDLKHTDASTGQQITDLTYSVPPIKAGQTETLHFPVCWPQRTVTVNPQGNFYEDTTSDNSLSQNGACPTVSNPNPRADLVIDGISSTSVTMRNAGDTSTAPFLLTLSSGGREPSTTYEINGLEPGQFRVLDQIPCSSVQRTALVDAANAIDESNETNNSAIMPACGLTAGP